jgi:hypothetical protein
MTATPAPQRDPEVSRIAQEVRSFRDELMGRDGNPGRLINLENELKMLKAQLSDTVRDAVADAMAIVHQRFDSVDQRLDKIDDESDGKLVKFERRLGSVEGWRKKVMGAGTAGFAILGALGTIIGLVLGVVKLVMK